MSDEGPCRVKRTAQLKPVAEIREGCRVCLCVCVCACACVCVWGCLCPCAAALCTSALVPGNNRILRMPMHSYTNLIPFPSRAKITCTLDFTRSPMLESVRPPPCNVERYPRDVCQQEVHVYFARGHLLASARRPRQHCMGGGEGRVRPCEMECTLFSLGTDPASTMSGCGECLRPPCTCVGVHAGTCKP